MKPWAARMKVRFAEIDRAGIVYYPRFFHYVHVAFEEFFDECVGTDYHVLIDEKRVGFPTVHAECDYRTPLGYGDEVEIAVSVLRIGRTSATLLYRIRNRTRRRLAAEARITVVCVDMDAFRPRRIPAGIRRVFERHLERGGAAPDSLGGRRRIG
jgi:4-hydroxybenzoyl-CoA thioesterase